MSMWMRVCDSLHFGTPLSEAWATIPGVDGQVTLAFQQRHLLRWYAAPKGGHIADSDAGAWQLEADVSHGFQFVFGYEIDPSAAATTPPTHLARPFSDELRRLCNDSGNPSLAPNLFPEGGAGGSDPHRIVVCVSLVCCEPRHDYDPGNTLLGARFYPLIEVIANKDINQLLTRIRVARPDLSTPRSNRDDMMDKIGGILVTDRNMDPSPIPTAPFWNLIFDDYDLEANGVYRMAEAVQGRFAEQRVDEHARKALTDGTDLPYVETRVTKQPGQAQFDSVHLAPKMVYVPTYAASLPATDVLGPDGLARSSNARYVSMAPFCQHDCLHTHWRWSTAYDRKQNRGWIERDGRYVPHAQPGAPLVPPNQSVSAEVRGAVMWIETTAQSPRAGAWQYVHHNGLCYAMGTSWDVNLLFLLTGAENWADLYDRFRFAFGPWDGGAGKPTFYERVLVASDDLATLMNL
jgi:hypothetical protein